MMPRKRSMLRIISTRYLLLVTSFGWLFTFMVLINQQLQPPSSSPPDCGNQALLNDETVHARGILPPDEKDMRLTVADSPANVTNTQLVSHQKSEERKEIVGELLHLRKNIMEVQYLLSGGNRQSSWSSNDKKLTQELVDTLWLHSQSIIDQLGHEECNNALMKSSDELVNAIHEVQSRSCEDERNKIAVCSIGKACGFGCQSHHLSWCFMLSFALNRTMVLEDGSWNYDRRGWADLFEPINDNPNCKKAFPNAPQIDKTSPDREPSERVVRIPIVDGMRSSPYMKKFLPSVPSRWAGALSRCHSNPQVWYSGHFIAYSMRSNEKLVAHLKNVRNTTNLYGNYFGLQVRRSDKINTEAQFHSLAEYMHYIHLVYNRMDKTPHRIKKEIYVATDEPKVLQEEAKEFPDYKFYGDAAAAARANSLSTRYADGSLLALLTDIILVSQSEYIVCTFSSQVCRISYELMQFERRSEDAAWRYQSLDDLYYYGGQGYWAWTVTADHNPTAGENSGEQIGRKGEEVKVMGNHWNGYSKIQGKRGGLFPSFKLRPTVPTFKLSWLDSR